MNPETLSWLQDIARDAGELRRTRRWRIGNAVVSLIRRMLFMPERETALDRIDRVVALLRESDKARNPSLKTAYETWRSARYRQPGCSTLPGGPEDSASGPLFEVLIDGTGPVATTDAWRRTLDGLRDQHWRRWRCRIVAHDSSDFVRRGLADDPRLGFSIVTDPEVLLDLLNEPVRAAADEAAGTRWLLPLRPGDVLDAHAMTSLAGVASTQSHALVIYGDEDTTSPSGRRSDPVFKPKFNPELMRSTNPIGMPFAARLDAVKRVGGLRAGFAEAGVYDLLLRLVESGGDGDTVIRVPEILGSRVRVPGQISRSDPAESLRRKAETRWLVAHLNRVGDSDVRVVDTEFGRHLSYPVPDPAPRVDIVIPTRDRLDLLAPCIESIRTLTDYSHYRIVIVDNGSEEPATREWIRTVSRDPLVSARRDDGAFNFARLNNDAVSDCDGDIVVLLNNDTEVLNAGWLTELVGLAARPDVGAVGCLLLYPNGTIQHAGVVLGVNGGPAHAHMNIPWDSPGYAGRAQLAQDLSAVTGACLATRRSVWNEVRGLDTVFASDFNDIDYCLRVRARGYRVIYTPHARLTHHESATRSQPDSAPRGTRELEVFRERWQPVIDDDPAYHPLLSPRFAFAPPGGRPLSGPHRGSSTSGPTRRSSQHPQARPTSAAMPYQSFPGVFGDSSSLDKLKALRLPPLKGLSFLDVGCNEGLFCGFAEWDGADSVTGIDSNLNLIESARRRFPTCEFLHTDWDHLPDRRFNVVLMASAIHYAEDQEALIHRLMSTHVELDGVFVLEMGVHASPENQWVQVQRGVDKRWYPTMSRLADILSPYAWKWMGPSVNQVGDPVPRHVLHIRPRRPLVYLLIEPSGYGKSTIARDLFKSRGVPVVSGDEVVSRVAAGTLIPQSQKLHRVIKARFDSLHLDRALEAICKDGLINDYVDLLMEQGTGTDLAIDAYIPPAYHDSVVSRVVERGCLPIRLNWKPAGRIQPVGGATTARADEFFGHLRSRTT